MSILLLSFVLILAYQYPYCDKASSIAGLKFYEEKPSICLTVVCLQVRPVMAGRHFLTVCRVPPPVDR